MNGIEEDDANDTEAEVKDHSGDAVSVDFDAENHDDVDDGIEERDKRE